MRICKVVATTCQYEVEVVKRWSSDLFGKRNKFFLDRARVLYDLKGFEIEYADRMYWGHRLARRTGIFRKAFLTSIINIYFINVLLSLNNQLLVLFSAAYICIYLFQF